MNNCPFCKEPIESYWTYCRNCNKPLITNLDEELNRRSFSPYDGGLHYSNDIEAEEDHYDINIINDESIEFELSELEDQLAESEKLGKDMGDLLLRKASLFYKKRDFPKALKNLELALENFLEEKDFLNVIISHNELGLIHEETGFFSYTSDPRMFFEQCRGCNRVMEHDISRKAMLKRKRDKYYEKYSALKDRIEALDE